MQHWHPIRDHGHLRIVAQDTVDDGGDLPPDVDPAADVVAVLERRAKLREEAEARLKDELKATADKLATDLRDYIEGRAGGTDTATVRAAIYQTRLNDLLRLLDEAGLASSRDAWFADYDKLAGLAEKQLAAAGIDDADRALDSETARAALAAVYEGDDAAWIDAIARPSAQRILTGLRSSIEVKSLAETVEIIARDEGVSLPAGTTLARTRMAEFDRWAQAEATRQIDPTGERIMWGYIGPDDGIERPFCDALNGKFFTREQVGRLDNNQPGTGDPMVSGGGYNCRHGWVNGTSEYLTAIGLEEGSDDDIDAANRGAQEKRRAA